MSSTTIRLSVIDTLWPGSIAYLVPYLDELGYNRYWATEHHSPEQSASPAIMVALAAGLSHRLRVGSAGVLLSLYSPRKVAADFRLLELLFPGRIDLGVVSAVPPEPVRGALLDGRPALTRTTFERKVEELAALIAPRAGAPEQTAGADGADGAGDGAARVDPLAVGPVSPSSPPLWVCGTSERSARLAGRLGARYALHHYQLDQPGYPGGADGRAVLDAYRDAFAPTAELTAPACVVACYGMCADTEPAARAHWEAAFTLPGGASSPDGWTGPGVPRPSFVGAPAQCADQLRSIAAYYRVDELVVQAFAPPRKARLDAYGLLAGAFALSPAPA